MFASAIWLVPQIADVSVSCGLKEDASEVQIQLVAAAIASKFKYLKTDEVMLFLFNSILLLFRPTDHYQKHANIPSRTYKHH